MIALALALTLAGAEVDAGPAHQTKHASEAKTKIELMNSLDDFLALPGFKANGVHVIHFWATWCPPCRDELPAYMKRAKQLAKHGVDFTFVTVDQVDDIQTKVIPFLREVDGNFPGARHVMIGPQIDPAKIGAALEPTWAGTIPVTFIFRDGKKLGFYSGAAEDAVLDHVPVK